MTQIFKYRLEVERYNYINMPKDAKILTIQNQYDNIFIWAEIDTEKETEVRTFITYGVDSPDMTVEENEKYIGTYEYINKTFTLHVYEKLGNYELTRI